MVALQYTIEASIEESYSTLQLAIRLCTQITSLVVKLSRYFTDSSVAYIIV